MASPVFVLNETSVPTEVAFSLTKPEKLRMEFCLIWQDPKSDYHGLQCEDNASMPTGHMLDSKHILEEASHR